MLRAINVFTRYPAVTVERLYSDDNSFTVWAGGRIIGYINYSHVRQHFQVYPMRAGEANTQTRSLLGAIRLFCPTFNAADCPEEL